MYNNKKFFNMLNRSFDKNNKIKRYYQKKLAIGRGGYYDLAILVDYNNKTITSLSVPIYANTLLSQAQKEKFNFIYINEDAEKNFYINKKGMDFLFKDFCIATDTEILKIRQNFLKEKNIQYVKNNANLPKELKEIFWEEGYTILKTPVQYLDKDNLGETGYYEEYEIRDQMVTKCIVNQEVNEGELSYSYSNEIPVHISELVMNWDKIL